MDCWRNWNNVVDLSSFMLLESTGDSEDDYSDQNMVDSLSSDDNMEAATCDIDDAQSCCSDSCDNDQDFYNDDDHHRDQEYVQFSKKIKGVDRVHCDYNPRCNYEEDEDDDDEDEGVIDQDLTSGQKEGFVVSKKKRYNNLYVNCTMEEPMNEEEKNKLFWETCLAS